MPKNLWSFVTAMLLISCSSSKTTTANITSDKNAKWQSKTIIVDGNSDDWDKSKMDFDKSSNVAYTVTNDAGNIYVLLTTADEQTQIKILQGGMALFIDPTLKKKEDISISYPLPSKINGMSGRMPPGQRQDMRQMKAIALSNANEYILAGFKDGNGAHSISQTQASGVDIKISFSATGELVYEAIIPFSSFSQN